MESWQGDAAIIDIPDVVVSGNDYTFTFTLSRDDGVTAALDGTLTADIVSLRNQDSVIINDQALTIADANERTATLSLSDAQTATLDSVRDFTKTVLHLADIKNVEAGGAVVHYGPFRFGVRKAVTS